MMEAQKVEAVLSAREVDDAGLVGMQRQPETMSPCPPQIVKFCLDLLSISHEFARIRHSDETEGERTPGDCGVILGRPPPGLVRDLPDLAAGSRFGRHLGFTVLPHGLERLINRLGYLTEYFYDFTGRAKPVWMRIP